MQLVGDFGFVERGHGGRGLADASAECSFQVDVFVVVIGSVFLGLRLRGRTGFSSAISGCSSAVTPAMSAAGLVAGHLHAFDHRVGDLGGKEADGAQGVIVAGDHVVDHGRIAIGVDHGDDRDAQLAGFLDGDGFVVRIDDEQGVGQPRMFLMPARLACRCLRSRSSRMTSFLVSSS